MFKSERLPIIVPQQEHARLAGSLALFWGNEEFDKPNFPVESLAKGLMFHHMGYGSTDNVAFRELSEKELLHIFEGDIDAELVNLFHQLRLINNRFEQTKSPNFEKLKIQVETMISQRLQASKYTREDFEWANRLTHICDRLSFNFCQGLEAEANVDVFPRRNNSEKISITNELVGTSTIVVDPWPFSVSEIPCVVVAYVAENYPNVLVPYLVQATVVSRR